MDHFLQKQQQQKKSWFFCPNFNVHCKYTAKVNAQVDYGYFLKKNFGLYVIKYQISKLTKCTIQVNIVHMFLTKECFEVCFN